MEKGPEISLLKNSYMYFLSLVFIIRRENRYTLKVIHNGRHLDETKVYKKPKGARIAFIKEWWYKAHDDKVKPSWTHFYPVDPKWLDDKLKENA